jgi:hypothetical protein
MVKLIYAIVVLLLVIALTLVFSQIINSRIDADIASSNHYGFTLDAKVLEALVVIVELHGLLLVIVEIITTITLVNIRLKRK